MRTLTPAIMALIAFASSAQAASFTVTTTASSGPGSFRQAILDSNSPVGGIHTIEFGAGFPDQGVISLDADLPQIASQDLTILGGTKQPVIDGQSLHQMVRVGNDTTTLALSDLTLARGFAAEKGGCINAGSGNTIGALQLMRVTLSECQASGPSLISGGAIAWQRSAGTISLIDSRLVGNTVTATAGNGESSGGAIYTTASLSALRTLFESNAALSTTGGSVGGAILLQGSGRSNSITESTFRFNAASPGSSLLGYGGAVALSCDNCTAQIVRSYLRGNAANFGGAVYARKSSAGATDVYISLANSTFYNSSVVDQGGAVWINARASLSASNNTFYNGDATSGAHFGFAPDAEVNYFRANLLAPTLLGSACSGSPTVTNTTFVGFNLFSDTGCAALEAGALANAPLGTILVDESPGMVGVLRFGGSAVIDSIANGTICEPRDARFQVRPIDGDGDGIALCDVGAYEDPRDVIFIDDFEA